MYPSFVSVHEEGTGKDNFFYSIAWLNLFD